MGPVTLIGNEVHDTATTPYTCARVKFAKIDISASGDLVAAVTGKRVRVLSLSLRLATSNTVKFQSGGSTDLTGAMTVTALDWPFNQGGWLQTASGEKLNLVEGSSVQASGCLSYIEV